MTTQVGEVRLLARIFIKDRPTVHYDVPMQQGMDLPQFISRIRMDGYFFDNHFFIPYDQIAYVATLSGVFQPEQQQTRQ